MSEPTKYRLELRGRIVESATSMFREKGIRSVRMDDIASCLTISKRTLYEIYENKEVLLCEVVEKFHKFDMEQMEELKKSSTSSMDFLIGIIRLRMRQVNRVNPVFYKEMMKYPKVWSLIEQYRCDSRTHSIDIIKKGVEEGYLLSNVNYKLIQAIADKMFQDSMASEYKDFDIRELFKITIILFIRSVCTERGIRMLDDFLVEMNEER